MRSVSSSEWEETKPSHSANAAPKLNSLEVV